MDDETCQALELACSCQKAPTLEPGITGRYSAVAAIPSGLVASAYENTFGDLLFLSADYSDLTKIRKEIVDGVPATAPTHPVGGWRGGISDPGNNVGTHTDIGIAANGTPVIAYHDVTNKSLKFANKSGKSWNIHTIALPQAASKQVTGEYVSLLFVNAKPAIAFTTFNIRENNGSFASEVLWATTTKEIPTSEADWQISTIARGPMACSNLCESSEACFVNENGSTQCKTVAAGCTACTSNEACLAGNCAPILKNLSFEGVPDAFGLWTSAVLTSNGPLVVFHDSVNGTLNAAILRDSNWKSAVLKGAPTNRMGAFCSAAADLNGTKVHVTYQHVVENSLRYAQIDLSTLAVTLSETIDNGQRADGLHPVGADSAVITDTSGSVIVFYQDQQNADLLMAKRIGPNQWTPDSMGDPNLGRLLLGGPRACGFYTDLVFFNNLLYGSTFFFDIQAAQKGNLQFFVTAP
ncbi:MAG: hypothetical protein V1754_13200 [Pseudomonadota bacterium]